MRITNVYGLPESLVRAVSRDDYDRGQSDWTVTELISAPQLVQLRRRHAEEIEVDVADRLPILLGQVMHAVLQRADLKNALTEERLYADIDGQRISGRMDRMVLTPEETLQDYKLTSVWALKDGVKPEWEAQLNAYAELLRRHSFHPARLEIMPLYRDWRPSEFKRESWYPPKPMHHPVPARLWSEDETRDYLHARVALHERAAREPDMSLPACTDEERWARPTRWALTKRGARRALKLYETYHEARRAQGSDPKLQVTERRGEAVRCAEYCEVAPFCRQFLANQPPTVGIIESAG